MENVGSVILTEEVKDESLRSWDVCYLAVDSEGYESSFLSLPYRTTGRYLYWKLPNSQRGNYESCVSLPRGAIASILGRPLRWEDEPVVVAKDVVRPYIERYVDGSGTKAPIASDVSPSAPIPTDGSPTSVLVSSINLLDAILRIPVGILQTVIDHLDRRT